MAKNKYYEDKTPATVGYVNRLVDEAVDTLLNGMQNMFDEQKKELRKIQKVQLDLSKGQKENSINIEVLKKGQEDIKEKLNDMTLSHPSREEFDALKKKVFRHHPSN